MQASIHQDLEAIGRISAVRIILKALGRATKMRISLVSRITNDLWTACSVIDDADFGLNTGDKLELETTY